METPSIWKSRKFWIMMVDTVVSLVTFFGTIYLKPEVLVQVTALIGILQVPILFVIDSYTRQNIEAIKSSSESVKYITNVADDRKG